MNRLKQLRIEAEESQEYVGTLIGVSGQAVGQYEAEKRDLSPDKILKLAEHFNCSTDYLLGKSDIRNPGKQIDEDKLNVAFSSGFDGLNETNKTIIKGAIEGLLAKQKLDEEKKNEK